jgi:hypothetical protein
LHWDSETGGLWFFKYWPKVFQSLRFWDSYRLKGAGTAWERSPPADLDDSPTVFFTISVDMIVVKGGERGFVYFWEENREEGRWDKMG